MADGFKETLESKSRRIRRWATRRHIESEGWICEPWYELGSLSDLRVLTLDRYKNPVATAEADGVSAADNYGLYYAPFEGEVWNHIFDQVSWVDEEIMKYGQSNLSALQSLIEKAQDVPEYLLGDDTWRNGSEEKDDEGGKSYADLNRFGDGSALADEFGKGEFRMEVLLESGMQELTYWNGATASAYRATFGDNGENWDEIAQNNYGLAECLVAAAEAQLEVFLTARESVINVCDKTIEALWGAHDGEEVNAAAAITVTGALLVLPLTLVSMTVAAAVVGAATSISATIVQDFEDGSEAAKTDVAGESIEISGGSPMAVLDSMQSRLLDVDSAVFEKEAEIKGALQSAYNTVTNSADSRGTFEIIFDEGTSMTAMGEREVSYDEFSLVNAATELFPRSTARVLSAHEALAGSDESGAFHAEIHSGSTLVGQAWTDLRDLLQDLTAANGGKIRFAGEFLLDYAVETGAVDEANAAGIRAAEDELGYDQLTIETTGREHTPTHSPGPDDPQ